jgi:hypothetical protein
MRRVAASPDQHEPSCYRVLGVIIPDLDPVPKNETSLLPTQASPILPLHLRPAVSAGVAIVHGAGPELMGENKARFGNAVDEIVDCARQSQTSSQLHLILDSRSSESQITRQSRKERSHSYV